MIADLEQRLDDVVTVHEELVLEVLALGRRLLRVRDELERLRDDLYADEQDDLVLLGKGA